MIESVLRKVQRDQKNMIIVTPAWRSQPWYPILLKMTIKNPILLPNHPKVLLSPERKIHPLIQNSSLRLVAWLVSGKIHLPKKHQEGLSTLFQMQSNYESTRRKWVSWCHRRQTDLLSNHLREVLDFLAEMFELRFEYSTINTDRSAISTFHELIEGVSVAKTRKFAT